MKTILFLSLLILSLSFSSCKPSEAESLYKAAVHVEHQPIGGYTSYTIEAYRKVILAAPDSSWAEKSQKRIDVIQQFITARNAAWSAEDAARDAAFSIQNATRDAAWAAEEAAYEARSIRLRNELNN